MTDFGWNYPPGVSQLPGESRAEQAYQRAYEDDAGYADNIRSTLDECYLFGMPDYARRQVLALPSDVLYALAVATGMDDVLSREDYAQQLAENGYPDDDDDREEPYE